MSGELGNEAYIDLLIVFSALSPATVTAIGNDDFCTKFSF